VSEAVTRHAPRGDLPEHVVPYRTIGSFDAATLPQGLRRTHDLKAGTWGLVQLREGHIGFVWEDGPGGRLDVGAPAEIVVPPQVPHHVDGDRFRLAITFFR
jgi:hemoglobin